MIKLPPLPKVGDFQVWKRRVIVEVAAATGRGDKGIAWISKVFGDDVKIEDLKDAGPRFESIDVKLLNSVHRITDGNPKGTALESEIQRMVSRGEQMNGRQALLVIVKTYGITGAQGLVYGLTTLMKVEWQGDGELQKFIAMWDKILLGMGKDKPSEKHNEEIFLAQMKKSKFFEQELRKYQRLPEADRSYAKLYAMIQEEIALRQLEQNRKDLTKP